MGLGKTVVRAGGGVFYDPFQTDLYRRALLNNGSPQYFAVSLTPQMPFAPSFPSVLPVNPQDLPSFMQDITTVEFLDLQLSTPEMRTCPLVASWGGTLRSRQHTCTPAGNGFPCTRISTFCRQAERWRVRDMKVSRRGSLFFVALNLAYVYARLRRLPMPDSLPVLEGSTRRHSAADLRSEGYALRLDHRNRRPLR